MGEAAVATEAVPQSDEYKKMKSQTSHPQRYNIVLLHLQRCVTMHYTGLCPQLEYLETTQIWTNKNKQCVV